MAIPTKTDAINAIKTIKKDGLNSAEKVQTVLTTVLEYTESVPSPQQSSNTNVFDISSDKPLTDRNTDKNTLYYSFRGIEMAFVSFTFNLTISRNDKHQYLFKGLSTNEVKLLREIIGTNGNNWYVIPIIRDGKMFSFPVKLFFEGEFLTFDFTDMANSDFNYKTITTQTSICIHTAKF